MAESDKRRHVHVPQTLGELLQLYRRRPGAAIYAGGTDLLKGVTKAEFSLPDEIISIQEIEELQRISRTDRYLEIGAAASISRVLEVGANIIPPALAQAMNHIGPPGLLSLATIGGNICSRQHLFSLTPILTIMDVRYELRRMGHSRWVPASRFRDQQGIVGLADDEVLTRIRIPLEQWNIQVFRQYGTVYLENTAPVVFSALAKTGKGVLDDFRLAFCAHRPILFRNRDLEADLVGRKVPLADRDIQAFLRGLEERLTSMNMGLSALQLHRVWALSRTLLAHLRER